MRFLFRVIFLTGPHSRQFSDQAPCFYLQTLHLPLGIYFIVNKISVPYHITITTLLCPRSLIILFQHLCVLSLTQLFLMNSQTLQTLRDILLSRGRCKKNTKYTLCLKRFYITQHYAKKYVQICPTQRNYNMDKTSSVNERKLRWSYL